MEKIVTKRNVKTTSINPSDVKTRLFTASFDLRNHPMIKSNEKIRVKYLAVLEYFVNQSTPDSLFINARLEEYKKALLRDATPLAITDANKNRIIKDLINNTFKPWIRKYRYLLFCDLALILTDEVLVCKSLDILKSYLSANRYKLLCDLNDALFRDKQFNVCKSFIQSRIHQHRVNHLFTEQEESRYIITGNMSAGKSTLINALVGKIVSCMKSEASTTSIHYIYDKPFEDYRSSKWDGVLTLDASHKTLMDYDERNLTYKIYVATHFSRISRKGKRRYCFIDTPGVNSAINSEHGKLTRKALKEENYNKLVYILNANRLGTDEELKHLKFVMENVSKDKMIFVLNKLDDFKTKDDSIATSIGGVRKDLLALGYENPTICPISAYFSLLVKKRLIGEALSEDEQDSFELFVKKFNRTDYDLSRFYPPGIGSVDGIDGELAEIAMKCGLYGLESILYGGVNAQ